MKRYYDSGVYELTNAIIKQAAQDYVKAKRKLLKHPDDEQAKETLEDVLSFFHSEWYRTLTDADADYIIQRLDESIKNKRRLKC